MNIASVLQRWSRKVIDPHPKPKHKVSYSQSGEDLIADYLLSNILGIQSPVYLDIGAFHPTTFSNTYLFYARGCSGVCVEANPLLLPPFWKQRPKDVSVNVGVIDAPNQGIRDFYVMDPNTISTFCMEECRRYREESGYLLKRVIQVPVMDLNGIVAKYCGKTPPHFVSIDVEGLDCSILGSFDFARCRPEVWCVETLNLVDMKKVAVIPECMSRLGYVAYADTFINTIFVDAEAFRRAKLRK